ncbi:MAG: acyl-CoA reductase [Rhodocyclaceae bacterium]|nr:acyl-CoA reductase [Rhodocyclaceae bacterium]
MSERRLSVDLPLAYHAGAAIEGMERRPLPPYAPETLAFLADLSRLLLADSACRTFPDIAAFGYWCRPANLDRLAQAFAGPRQRIGRGLALHIAPANVPVNFAFTLAFGMLAGNANIVRVPEQPKEQTLILCAALRQLFATPAHARIAAMNRVVGYPRDDAITAALSACCNARVLWGGDRTIAHLRQLPMPARCVEIAFADRYSLCMLDAASVAASDAAVLDRLAEDFYNDAYLLDQNACSSPHLVIWLGDEASAAQAQERFWPALAGVVRRKYPLGAVQAVDKLSDLCRIALELPAAVGSTRHGNDIYRIRLAALAPAVEKQRGRHGLFLEYVSPTPDCLETIVDEKYQTLSCFGVDRENLAQMIVDRGLLGIDRIVPVGRALDIGPVWDGYDIVATLSRIVATQ